jgi:hypothetical protein
VLEQGWNRLEGTLLRNREVSRAILARFGELALSRGASFVVAGIYPDEATAAMLEAGRGLGWHVVDIAVDFDDPRYNNLPWDTHPNARAHRVYAAELSRFLTTGPLWRQAGRPASP